MGKKMRVTIPGIDLDKVMGPRDENMNENTTKTQIRLKKKQEELASLEFDEQILDVKDRIKKRERGEPVSEAPRDSLAETIVKEAVLPIVKEKLAENKKNGESDSMVDRALRIAETAVRRSQPTEAEGKGALDELDKGISIFTKLKDLIEGERAKKVEAGESVKKEVNALSEIDQALGLVATIRDTFPQKRGSGELSPEMIEFKKWEKEFDLKHKIADREERLARRKQDKAHDIELGKLGIEKERNELLRDGFKRIGRAIAMELGEEDEYEEEEPAPAKGRGQLIKATCEICGAEILIPPESQVEGKEIKCSKCPAVFTWG